MEELVVLEMQSEINPAMQMVARWTVSGDGGQDGGHAQLHVVGECKLPQG